MVFAVFLTFASIIYITVINRTENTTSGEVILTPLASYCRYFFAGQREALRSNIMNILLFFPLGLFLAELCPVQWKNHTRLLLIAILCGSLSISIEAIQYLRQSGLCETDDVLNNLIGALLGAQCVRWELIVFDFIKKHRQKYQETESGQ